MRDFLKGFTVLLAFCSCCVSVVHVHSLCESLAFVIRPVFVSGGSLAA